MPQHKPEMKSKGKPKVGKPKVGKPKVGKPKVGNKTTVKFAMEFLDTPPRSSLRDTSINDNFTRRLSKLVDQRDARPLANLVEAGRRLYDQDLLELDEEIVTPLVAKMETLRDSAEGTKTRNIIARFIQPYFEIADEIYSEGGLPFVSGRHSADYDLWSRWERQSRRLRPQLSGLEIQNILSRYRGADPELYRDIESFLR